jgi:transcriptional regulator GlxA family with amidase domain
MPTKRTVAVLLFDEVEVLDFAGPFEVFGVADGLHEGRLWRTVTVAENAGTVRTINGLKIVPEFTLENCPAPQVLVIPGGSGTRPLLQKPGLLEWIRFKARTAECVFSVCTGALVLGQAGLLDGLTVTTHHRALDLLREVAPKATVDPAVRFCDNGKILTSAGISAGIDAAFHLVARLAGNEVADTTARYMEYAPQAGRIAGGR